MDDVAFDDLDLNVELERLLDAPLPPPQNSSRLRDAGVYEGFDDHAGATWIYPNNLPLRAYQLNIVQATLFRNTLVVLPTGLGKTFIAAVVMYNIYRWYPRGKVIFMAPTRPLVAQQIDACRRIMPFPARDTAELTGKLAKSRREEQWRSNRVFFVTPQVLQSDIGGGIASDGESITDFPFNDVKLVVIDEAHKAKGRYAYVEVVRSIWQRNRNFRILALSATPGRTMEDVATVVRNLYIAHVEVRFDNSIDVAPYVHKRNMRTIVVPMGEHIKRLRHELIDIIDPYLRELQEANALSHSALHTLNRNVLIYEQKSYRERSMHDGSCTAAQKSKISSNFSICVSLYYALELLERHGLRVFLNSFDADDEGKTKFVLNVDRRLRELVQRVRSEVGPNPFDVSAQRMTNGKIAAMPQDLDFGHPKFEQARQCVLQHFQNHNESRAIVFCEYRESVMLIYRLLLQHVPTIRPRCFVGQGGTTGSLRALTQKQQIEIMNDFRSGKSNVLIATCIGEEGIDVGEVELIVCFDISTSNPTRFIQRIGRTGRQKQGNVIMLVTEGREQQLLKDVLSQKDQTNRKLQQSSVVRAALYKDSPPLVPSGMQPKCVHTYIKPPEDNDAAPAAAKTTKALCSPKKKGSKNFEVKGTQDLRKFFSPTKRNAKQRDGSAKAMVNVDEIYELSDCDEATPRPPGTETQKCTERYMNRFNALLNDVSAGGVLASNTQLLATSLQPTLRTSPSDNPPRLVSNVRYMRKLNAFMQNTTPVLSTFLRITNFHTQLKSKKLSVAAKRVLLKLQPQFVRDTLDGMRVLEALDVGVDEATHNTTPEEREVRANYELVAAICGGSVTAIDGLLDEIAAEQAEGQNTCNFHLNDDVLDEIVDNDFDKCLAHVFNDLETSGGGGRCHDNYDYIQNELKKTQHYNHMKQSAALHAASHAESFIYDTISDDMNASSYNCSHVESKYCSQWDEFSSVPLSNKSTPLLKSKEQPKFVQESTRKCSVLCEEAASPTKAVDADDDTDDILMASFLKKLEESSVTSTEQLTTNASYKESTPVKSMLAELDMDLNMFMDPFPEEQLKSPIKLRHIQEEPFNNPSPNGSIKENFNYMNGLDEAKHSPDIFDVTIIDAATTKKQPLTAAVQQSWNTQFKSPARINSPVVKSSPKQLKSPSVFDLYMRSLRGGRGIKAPTSPLARTKATASGDSIGRDSPLAVNKPRTSKRRILDSDSSDNDDVMPQVSNNRKRHCDDVSVVAVAQKKTKEYKAGERQRKKQRRICHFIDDEAGVSGDSSDDDVEHTLDNDFVSSILVRSSDEEEGEADGIASTSYMHGVYLQSVKSPARRPDAFKIPNHRVFNDHDFIYSQPVAIENSQYVPDSFVVHEHEDDSNCNMTAREKTLSPLEKAERILKQRRLARRRGGEMNKSPASNVTTKKTFKRRIITVSSGSSSDFEST